MISIILIDGDREAEVQFGTPAWSASMEWARFHGLDPMRIPAGSTVERAGNRILFTEFVKTGPGPGDVLIRDLEPVTVDRVEENEAPPMPFPDVVWTDRS